MNTLAAVTVVSLVALLAGCAGDAKSPPAAAPVPVDAAHNSRNSLDWAGTYHGVLPCADCAGIDTVLTLAEDGSFETRSRYLGKDAAPSVEQGSFTWHADGGAVTLAGDPPVQYRVGENRLTRLALDGSVITGDLAERYALTKVPPGILDKHWQLVELRGQPVPALRQMPHIRLEAEGGRVTGYGGCNSLGGAYTLDEAALRVRFENIVTTLRACVEGMDTEQALHEVLGMVDNYSLHGNQLSLNRARMAPLARFEAVYTP